MVSVKYEDLTAAFDFVSFGAPMEHQAYISLDTGTIYWVSEFVEEEEVPEDLETSDRYVAVPHKHDLDLGRNLALRFAEEVLPDRYDTVQDIFRHRGAYARFKNMLASEGHLDKWYAFEAESIRKALKEWCTEQDIELIGEDNRPSA